MPLGLVDLAGPKGLLCTLGKPVGPVLYDFNWFTLVYGWQLREYVFNLLQRAAFRGTEVRSS